MLGFRRLENFLEQDRLTGNFMLKLDRMLFEPARPACLQGCRHTILFDVEEEFEKILEIPSA